MPTTPEPDLDKRLARIEALLEGLTQRHAAWEPVLEMAAPTATALVDSLDQAAARRGDVDARLAATLRLAELISAPGQAERLERLLHAVDSAPGMAALAVDTVDRLAAGSDPSARLEALTRLAEVVSRPSTTALITTLVGWAEQAPGVAAGAVDTFDAVARQISDGTWSLDERLHAVTAVVERASRPDTARRLVHALDGLAILDDLLESGVLDRGAVKVVGQVGLALRETAAQPQPALGLWGALRAASQTEIRRAIGFFLSFARNFGARLLA